MSARGREIGRLQRRRAAAFAATAPGLGETCSGALADKRALELRDGPEHVKDEHAARCGRVDALGQRDQPDPASLELLGSGDQLRERTRQPVELPDHQSVALAQHVAEDTGELGAIVTGARCALGEDPLATGTAQSVQLQLRALVGGADPRIADPHERHAFSEAVG